MPGLLVIVAEVSRCICIYVCFRAVCVVHTYSYIACVVA